MKKGGMMQLFKKNEFRAALLRKGWTIAALAKEIGINEATLSKKINGHTDFTREEVSKISKALGLSDNEIMAIFFAE